MERREMGENRDGWFYTGRMWYEQGQEESGSLPASEEGQEHDKGGACCHCKKRRSVRVHEGRLLWQTLLQEE